jgi:hypothetical protein
LQRERLAEPHAHGGGFATTAAKRVTVAVTAGESSAATSSAVTSGSAGRSHDGSFVTCPRVGQTVALCAPSPAAAPSSKLQPLQLQQKGPLTPSTTLHPPGSAWHHTGGRRVTPRRAGVAEAPKCPRARAGTCANRPMGPGPAGGERLSGAAYAPRALSWLDSLLFWPTSLFARREFDGFKAVGLNEQLWMDLEELH